MAKGLPDWQDELRTYKGSTYSSIDVSAVAPNTTDTLITVTGKGVVTSAYLYTDGKGETIGIDHAILEIDGNLISLEQFNDMYFYKMIKPHGNFYYLASFDPVNFNASVLLGSGLCFEETLKLKYFRAAARGVDADVFSTLYYTLISG